jgi:outer membrane protein assembly factor BamB
MSQQARPTPNDFLFLGTHGHVVAVNKRNGRKAWQMSLPKTGWDVVAIVYEEDTLFCATKGRLFALDPFSGEILWKNDLKGLGSDLVFLTTAQSNNTEAIMTLLKRAADKKQAEAAAAAS